MSDMKQQGFTLVELIVVIVIVGILSIAGTQFIVNTVKGYSSTSVRDKSANSLRISLAKIDQQLANSLTGSVRAISNGQAQCIEVLPIITTAFLTGSSQGASQKQLEIIGLNNEVIGSRAILKVEAPATPTRQLYLNAIAHKVIAQKDEVQSDISQISLAKVLALPAKTSIIDFVSNPVSYCLEEDKLWRYSDYPIKARQPDTAALPSSEPQRVLLNQNMHADSYFKIDKSTGALEISLTSRVDLTDNPEKITLYQQWGLINEEASR